MKTSTASVVIRRLSREAFAPYGTVMEHDPSQPGGFQVMVEVDADDGPASGPCPVTAFLARAWESASMPATAWARMAAMSAGSSGKSVRATVAVLMS